MKTGALQSVPVRQLITPEPYSPPTTNAAFFIDGITATHSALPQSSSGIPLSGVLRSSVRMAPASARRLTSSLDRAANAELAISDSPHITTSFFMPHPPRLIRARESPTVRALSCPVQVDRKARAVVLLARPTSDRAFA